MPSHRRIAPSADRRKALARAVGMDMGKEMVAYLEIMYPDVFERMNSGCRLAIRNYICNDFVAVMEIVGAENHLDRLNDRAAFRRKWLATYRNLRISKPKKLK